MLNQPQFVYSYTIPYYINEHGESLEQFVSEKTYDLFLAAQTHMNNTLFVIHGDLHPHGPQYGEVTDVLFDRDKVLLILGTKDLVEYTNEILDISIAHELVKITRFSANEFFHFTYRSSTPESIQVFVDDFQHVIKSISISKHLNKHGYRIEEREQQFFKDLIANKQSLSFDDNVYNDERFIFIVSRLLYLKYINSDMFSSIKQQLHTTLPMLFIYVHEIDNCIKKYNLSTNKGQQKALLRLFQEKNIQKEIVLLKIDDVPHFTINIQQ
ncbi:hypothetical protein [Bacillus alkalicellulosilyticus]|uniref:hypothetical protein n=1 Tax=Alkalihalobacterium alkalicellulosilyticum TaxID=1912214 RepID=UPI000997852D|nr:hypothetical protein [Bacillus alkalicellulosilyticus]